METQPVVESLPALPRASGRGLPRLQELGLLLVVLIIGGALTAYGWHDARPGRPNTFLNSDNIIEGVATPMSYYTIMAVGMTVVIITGGIDISVGAIVGLAALSSAAVLMRTSEDWPRWLVYLLAVVVPLVVGSACGLINGLLIVFLNLHPFIVTLGTLAIFRGLANVLPWFSDKTLVVPKYTQEFMRLKSSGLEIMPLIIMLICVAAGMFYLHFTIAGRETYAIGGNEEAARFSGLNIRRIKLRTYLLAGLTCGAAAIVSLGRFGSASNTTGDSYELTVIAAAVVGGASLSGGRGTAMGAFIGMLIIALIQDGIYITHWPEEYRKIITGSAIILAAALDQLSEVLRRRRLVRSAVAARSAEA